MGAAPRSQQGAASGLLATGRVIGQSLSVALTGAVFVGLGGSAAGNVLALQQQHQTLSAEQVSSLQSTFVSSLHSAFLVCAAFAALGILTSLVRGNESDVSIRKKTI